MLLALGVRIQSSPGGVAPVAAVVGTAVPGQWLAAEGDMPHINHFVIGVFFRKQGQGLPAAAAIEPASCARKAALQAGWVLKPTVADGNCGPDVMAYHLEIPRNMDSWIAIRKSIADFMFQHAGEDAWQEVAHSCDEGFDASGGPDPKGGLGLDSLPVLAFGGSLHLPALPSPAPPKAGAGAALEILESDGENSSDSGSRLGAMDDEEPDEQEAFFW